METIAVYWEPVIRVYGFETRTETAMLELNFPIGDLEYWNTQIDLLATAGVDFIMNLLQLVDPTTARYCLVMDKRHLATCRDAQGRWQVEQTEAHPILHHPVDVLFFHGPHFQDRYGIAEAVFRTLDRQRLTLLAAGCTGTSIYLITAAGQAEAALEMLSVAFEVPNKASQGPTT